MQKPPALGNAWKFATCLAAILALALSFGLTRSFAQNSGTVKVGVLQSLSGTMAISEVTVKNATLLAIDQVNASGGVPVGP